MPRYVIDEAKLEANLRLLASVRKRAGVKILLAQKAFSCFALYPLVAKYLDGATARHLFADGFDGQASQELGFEALFFEFGLEGHAIDNGG